MLAATPFVQLYARWRFWQLSMERPTAVQEGQLIELVRKAASTQFGRDHDFAGIDSVAAFQERVPLRRYEDFWNDYWRADFPRLEDCTWPGTIPYFARTSGTTTGITKFIPCSREMLSSNLRAAQDLLLFHLLWRTWSRVLGGKTLILGGSTDLHEEAPGIYSGDLSGIQANEVPWWAQPYALPPREIALLADWEEKIDRIARLALDADIRAISGTPSWLLVLFDKLAELHPDGGQRLVDHFPRLELLIHGGVDFRPYATRFADLLEGSHAELREVYPASEGFIAIADRGQGEGLRLVVDNGIFYEFVPVDELESASPTRHWLANVEPGINYAIVVSTCAGVWGYILGDTVRLIERDPPRIRLTGRTSYVLSAFGEHLIDSEIEEAVAVAADAIHAAVAEYCVAPVVPQSAGAKGGHHYVVEFSEVPPASGRIEMFRDALDDHLRRLNEDYQAHRAGDYGLRPPDVQAVAPGTFRGWMKKRGQLGGQHKVPRIVNDAALFETLLMQADPDRPVEGS